MISMVLSCCMNHCYEYKKRCSGVIPENAMLCDKIGYNAKSNVHMIYNPNHNGLCIRNKVVVALQTIIVDDVITEKILSEFADKAGYAAYIVKDQWGKTLSPKDLPYMGMAFIIDYSDKV